MEINANTNPFVAVMAQQYQLDTQSRNSAFAQERQQHALEKNQEQDQIRTNEAIAAAHASVSVYA